MTTIELPAADCGTYTIIDRTDGLLIETFCEFHNLKVEFMFNDDDGFSHLACRSHYPHTIIQLT